MQKYSKEQPVAHEVSNWQPQWGGDMLRHTGMCSLIGLLFHPKSLDIGPILIKELLRRGSHFKIAKKLVKSAIIKIEKPLEMGPDLQNFEKQSNQPCFEEKNP